MGGNDEKQIRTSKGTGTLIWVTDCYSETRACQEQGKDDEGAGMRKPSEQPKEMIFVAPDKGTANLSLTAEQIIIIAAAIGNISYDIEAGPSAIDRHPYKEMKVKTIHACIKRAPTFNALAVELARVAMMMETEEGI